MSLSRPSKFTHSTVVSIVSALLLVGLIRILWPVCTDFARYALSVLHYPYAWALTENENLLAIHGLMNGQNVYNLYSLETSWYFVYPPLFHLLASLLMKLFGFSVLIPRLISLVSLVGLAGLLFSFFRKQFSWLENGLVTFILMVFALSFTVYAKYYVLARADLLGLLLAFGSLYATWRLASEMMDRKDRKSWFLVAGGLAIAALLTKQSLFFSYIVSILLTVTVKDRREWLRYIFYLGLATVGVLILLVLATGGGFFQSLQLASQIYGKYLNSAQHLFRLQSIFIANFWPLLLSIPALAVIAVPGLARRESPVPFSLVVAVALYFTFLITGGNQGAEHNTLIPLIFGLLLVMKELYGFGKEHILQYIGIALFVGLTLGQIKLWQLSVNPPHLLPSDTDRINQARLIELLHEGKDQTVLGDRVDFAIIEAGKRSRLEASTHNVAREYSKSASYAKAVEDSILVQINNREIERAVVTITRFGKRELLTAIESQGQIIEKLTINYLDAPGLVHTIYRLTPPLQ